MSFDSAPPKVEVMGWNAHSLAEYMKRLRLSGCDKVVMKASISGAQFLQMTESELQKFPSIHVPIITKIRKEINRGDEKRVFGQRSKAPQFPKQDFTQEGKAWDSDEFDSDSDNDYEDPDKEGEDSYICALSQQPEAGQRESEGSSDDVYEQPPSADKEQLPRHLTPTKPLGNSDYIDSVCAPPPTPAGRTPRPPQRPGPQASATNPSKLAQPPPSRLDPSPCRPFKAAGQSPVPSGPAMPYFDGSKKPAGHSALARKDSPNSTEGSPFISACSPNNKVPHVRGPKPPDQSNRAGIFIPTPPPRQPPSQPSKTHNTQLEQTKGLDLSWYVGQATRCQAEAALRKVNKDGTFLVRDSSKGLSEQPYTLMVLNQGKVYNIQVRNHDNSYYLGTGHKSFPRVKEMIGHHTNTPLLLIVAMNYGAQSQCCLLHPAGL